MSGRKAKALRRLAKRHGWSRFQYQAAKGMYLAGDATVTAVVNREAHLHASQPPTGG